uniref:Uncharacterized protein n=1 Tax=Zooxanthella nutricula TaxID=1333877 RepID=A0A7S2KD40_9DINO
MTWLESGRARKPLPGLDGGVFSHCMVPDMEDAFSHSDTEDEELAERLLGESSGMAGGGYVRDVGSILTPQAHLISGPVAAGDMTASSLPPCEVEVVLPETWKIGQLIRLQGPYGEFTVRPPADAATGTKTKIRLVPRPEFRIEVPPAASTGSEIKFTRADGAKISVQVPEGMQPGERFDVLPPAMMVQVPKGACAGRTVVFSAAGSLEIPEHVLAGQDSEARLCRVTIPKGYEENDYFAVRLPAMARADDDSPFTI